MTTDTMAVHRRTMAHSRTAAITTAQKAIHAITPTNCTAASPNGTQSAYRRGMSSVSGVYAVHP